MEERRTNLVPFSEPVILTSENILNLVIFVPLGVYAGILFGKWDSGKKLLFIFSLSLLVEAIQYIFRIGAFDTTDIITNTLGGITGIVIFKGLVSAFNNSVKAQRFVNICATIGTALVIVLLVLLKLNLLPVRYE
jgi:glycopeptide antibiotics resistance protein